MKCPHCLVDFHAQQTLWSVSLAADSKGVWVLKRFACPACGQFILFLENGKGQLNTQGAMVQPSPGVSHAALAAVEKTIMVWPKGVSRAPVPPEVPTEIAQDYLEACLVISDSPKASAALSRRCLQHLLRLAAGVKTGDLSTEIQQVLDSGKLPSTIAENIDAVRNIGNFGAHPNKSKTSGEIVPVEPDEAEWNLDVLESLFDFYFVQPARAKSKREALNKKLTEAGKPPLK